MQRVFLVSELTPAILRRLHPKPADQIAFFRCRTAEAALAKGTLARLSRIDFKDHPPSYMAWLRLVHQWVERIFESPRPRLALADLAGSCEVPVRHLESALKKAAALEIADDAKLFLLGGALFPEAERIHLFRWPELAALSGAPAGPLSARPGARTAAKLAAYAAWVAARVAMPAQSPPTRRRRPTLLIEESYQNLAENPEILSFYRYLKTRDDVVYNATNPGSDFLVLARSEGKEAHAHRWGVPGLKRKVRTLRRLAAAAGARKLPLPLRYWLVKLVGSSFRCESLFASFQPRVYIRIRADIEPSHPMATAAAEANGARNVGYACGSYPYFDFHYAWLDFHDYGTLGPGFREIFGKAWPDWARYETLGPFMVEIKERRATPPPQQGLVLAAFSTSTGDGFYAQEPVHRAFIEAVCSAARKIGAKVLFKEKVDDHEAQAFIRRSAQGLDFEIFPYDPDGPRAQEVLERADIAAVMISSSTAWEALGLLKKLAILQQPWAPHPLDVPHPRLVARSEPEFVDLVSSLASTPQADYERSVLPLARRWCKVSDGNLVRDFVECILEKR